MRLPPPQGQEGRAISEKQMDRASVSVAPLAGTRLSVVALLLAVLSVVVPAGYYLLYTPIGFITLGTQVQNWLIAVPLFLSGLFAFGAIVQGRNSLTASRQVQPRPRRATILAWVAIVLGAIEIVLALAALTLLLAWVTLVPSM